MRRARHGALPTIAPMQIHPAVFKAYDIRGTTPTTLNEAFAEGLGLAFGTHARSLGERVVAVGRDGRLSGPSLSAALVRVEYGNADRSRISRLHASGGVTLVSQAEAAEAREAVYDVAAGTVEMTGDVLLTQAENVLSGQRLTVDLRTGTGQMDGRVRTILQPGTKP